jgi:hypothetical protein
LSEGLNSDFSFDPVTVAPYRRYPLSIIPDDVVKEDAKIAIHYSFRYDN